MGEGVIIRNFFYCTAFEKVRVRYFIYCLNIFFLTYISISKKKQPLWFDNAYWKTK